MFLRILNQQYQNNGKNRQIQDKICEIEWEDFIQQIIKFSKTCLDINLNPETTIVIGNSEKLKTQPSTFLIVEIVP